MPLYYTATIPERRQFDHLVWLSLIGPEIARTARPGQFVLVRVSPSFEPLLWSVFFLAGADHRSGTVELLIDPRDSVGGWLAGYPVGTQLDVCMPVVPAVTPNPTTQTLLLAGVGPTLPALLFTARQYAARLSISLWLTGDEGYLPPPFLLPATVEVQTSTGGVAALFNLLTVSPVDNPIRWADQIIFALPPQLFSMAVEAIRTVRLRWEHGFAQVIVARPLPCGLGICRVCQIETRYGWQRCCVEGPVFDLRDLRLPAL